MESSLKGLLKNNSDIYQSPDDIFYSPDDLLYNHQKFLKQYFTSSQKSDLLVSLAWLFALINRFHMPMEDLLWRRYAYKCPHCLDIPCICDNLDERPTKKTGRPPVGKPETVDQWQQIIQKIYPNIKKEEMSKKALSSLENIQSSLRTFIREKRKTQHRELESKITDYLVTMIGLYNITKLNIFAEYQAMFSHGCYVCHKTPCECNFFE